MIERLSKDKERYEMAYTAQSEALASKETLLTVTASEKDRLDREQKALFCNVSTTDARIENLKNIRWWIAQHVRSNYRRVRVVDVRFTDLCNRICWLSQESFSVGEVIRQIEIRLENIPQDASFNLAREWLERFDNRFRIMFRIIYRINYLILRISSTSVFPRSHTLYFSTRIHHADIDALQEALLLDEIDRLNRDHAIVLEFDSLIEVTINDTSPY